MAENTTCDNQARRDAMPNAVGIGQDITILQRVHESLERTNRALQTLSACNAALVRAEDETALLRSIGQILIERGGYEAVWIGVLADETDKHLTDALAYGRLDPLHADIPLDWRPRNTTPMARALRERRPVRIADFAQTAGGDLWRRMHYHGGIFLPLFADHLLYGLLAIYTRPGDEIDADAAELLEEMASDLSYGIASLRTRGARDRAQQALAASECNLRTVIERVSEGMLVLDGDGRVLYANPAARNLLGRQHDRMFGETLGLPQVHGELTEVRVVRPDGSIASADMRVVQAEWYAKPARIIALHDTTAQRQAQEQVRLWARVFERSQELILVTDPKCRVIAANRAFERLTGYTADTVLGTMPDFLATPSESAAPLASIWEMVRSSGHWQGELVARRDNGSVVPLWAAISAAHDGNDHVQNYILIASDISEQKEAEARIEYLAYHDALTGLANRALFDVQLELAIAHARRSGGRFGVLFIDLDRFKSINDMFGHRAGDELLAQVARRLRGAVREEDTICRQGGDEFVILLSHFDKPTDLAAAAAKLLYRMNRPFEVAGTRVPLTASIGIAAYPEDGGHGEALVHNADTAMYYAKEQGRNNYQFFRDELNRRVVERIRLENDLRRAIERGEFVLHYQPLIRSVDGTVVGAEALVRWHYDGVIIEPDVFIGLAEETGLIVPIGDWVLEQACRQSRQWREDGLPALRIAVNLSASQFHPQQIERLYHMLHEYGINPPDIELELTERVLMHEAESSVALLRSLKESGLSVAIDDFGTGYSSLNYLRRFPIDRIKIDQSFIRDLATDPVDRAVTETIVALARSLHVAVVAEGVETMDEEAFMKALQCEELQGFLYGEPMPAADFVHWWRQRIATMGERGHDTP